MRKSPFKSIQDTEHTDLSRGYITKKLRDLFSNGSLRSLYVLGKFVQTAIESREKAQNLAFTNLTSRGKKSQSLTIFLLTLILFIFYSFALSCCRFCFLFRLLYTCSKTQTSRFLVGRHWQWWYPLTSVVPANVYNF